MVYHNHIIWCPQRRCKVRVGQVRVGQVRVRLKQIVREVVAENERALIRVASQPDHVHLFI